MDQAHWDLMILSEESKETYHHSVLLTDRVALYQWVYWLKTKGEMPSSLASALQKWYSDTALPRAKISLMWFNAKTVTALAETLFALAYQQLQHWQAVVSVPITGCHISSASMDSQTLHGFISSSGCQFLNQLMLPGPSQLNHCLTSASSETRVTWPRWGK